MSSVPGGPGRVTSASLHAARAPMDIVLNARERERAGCIPEAIEQYEAAIVQAERNADKPVLAEALRRLARVRHERGEREQAWTLCNRSYQVARDTGNDLLAGEALNTQGVMRVREGSLGEARECFIQAMAVGGSSGDLRARVERNLGVMANIQGDLAEAHARYARSFEESRALGDEHGCAIAFHNLGLVSADQRKFDEADRYFRDSSEIAERAGDVRLHGLCLLSRAEKVDVPRQQFEDARRDAEAALVVFDQLGDRDAKGSAYRVLGVVYRETGRHVLAESRLRSAIELSVAAGSLLHEAEGTRELALLYQVMGRNQEALSLLNAAHRHFRRLEAQRDLVNVAGKMESLEATYFDVVREWGQSIESSDAYTFGHCERVAQGALAVAQEMGLDEQEQKLIRLGAYLHDVGKVKVPHEVLNKPGPLTRDEFEVMQMHTVWGIELLADVEFPWDIKPIIRWHHERYDGTGYPDRLQGDEFPLSAQIVGIADVYDALTTTRAYRTAQAHETAVAEITRCRGWWSERVYDAFMRGLGSARPTGAPEGASAS